MNKEELERFNDFAIGICPHRHPFYTSEEDYVQRFWCSEKKEKVCPNSDIVWNDDDLCPHDCPYHYKNLKIECEPQKCTWLKKTIKRFTDGEKKNK